ncbi:hypothetical protein CXIVA_16300 [Clostridium sp. SY8519]|uniref:hypothetical protein n=1 Tax=Clostridium sp. (strain SY8519) TaxID=1042156 RepID=UPI0002171BE2|nr:hypothetical protein [Clostridium sp. SY8519]BAK47596.1 hypothetical protein CXIVA_16300 [Clostridium sp. SY8519]
MSDRFYKFQDVFKVLLEVKDKETRDEKIRFEQMMTADLLGTLINAKNAETREEGDAILAAALSGDRVADEFSNIMNASTAGTAGKDLYDLVDLMASHSGTLGGSTFVAATLAGKHDRFADELTVIKNVAKRVEGDKDIDALMNQMLDYAGVLAEIKSAPSIESGDEIIRACLTAADIS